MGGGNDRGFSGFGAHMRCGKDARVAVSAGLGQADLAARIRTITKQSTAVLSWRLKPRHSSATFIKKTGHSRNLGRAVALAQSSAALPEARTELPIIYTGNGFVLIRLHPRSAVTISGSVTSRERVGRNMSLHESTCSDTRRP